MVSFKQYSQLRNYNLLDLYLFLSFVAATALWSGSYLIHQNIYDVGFFASSLLVGSYYYFVNGLGITESFSESSYLPLFFVFQIICSLGLGHDISSAYFAMVPCFSGIFYFIYNGRHSQIEAKRKSSGLVGITVTSFVLMSFMKNWNYSALEVLTFSCAFLWTAGIITWGGDFVVRNEKSTLFKMLKKTGKRSINLNEQTDKERFFFHDLINQTHGMLLFLGLKRSSGLSAQECESLSDEIRVIQGLIQDHFGYKHKNLDSNKSIISFDSAKVGLLNLVDSFLPADKVRCHFVFSGDISDSSSFSTRKNSLVHYPSFHRIMNNIIKNLAEAQIDEVEMKFDYSIEGLSIMVKNRAFKLKDSRKDLADNLRSMILKNNDPNSGQGIGLESIGSICEGLGGSFNFQIEGEYWVSQVFLPRPSTQDSEELFAA